MRTNNTFCALRDNYVLYDTTPVRFSKPIVEVIAFIGD